MTFHTLREGIADSLLCVSLEAMGSSCRMLFAFSLTEKATSYARCRSQFKVISILVEFRHEME